MHHEVAAKNLTSMTEPSDNYDPTEADLDLILEDVTRKPVKPADLATGIA